jgi:GcrA cell cycle regulator
MTMKHELFDWNETVLAKLRELWDEGLSTLEIAKRLGTTKNAVGGKTRRLRLPARSPNEERRGRAWSEDEDNILRTGVRNRLGDVEISALLVGRSRGAVKDRRHQLEIRLHPSTLRHLLLSGNRAMTAKSAGKPKSQYPHSQSRGRPKKTPGEIFVSDGKPKPPALPPVHEFDLRCASVPYEESERNGCRWLLGDRRPWMACAAHRMIGESYCLDHMERSRPYYAIQMEQAA